MMKMKLNKKIAGASAMLLLSATMLGTSTFAWFTMNKTVTVTGMEMKTKVSGNLLICGDNVEADYATAELSQTRAALLEPVSSVSGATGSFYYTVDGKANGDARTDAYTLYSEAAQMTSGVDIISTTNNPTRSSSGAGKAAYDAAFNGSNGGYNLPAVAAPTAAYVNGYGYVDYTFYLKATADTTDKTVNLTKLNLLYQGDSDYEAVSNTDKAWRAAIFVSDITSESHNGDITTDNAVAGNLKGILALAGSQTQNKAAGGASDQAVNGTGANFGDVTYYNASTAFPAIATLSDHQTGYYKVTVRVWLEGEDTTCTSATYALLTNNWKLDAEFSIDSTKSPITQLGSEVPTP